MGELRKVSRKLELKLGAPKVYGTLKGGKASAPRKKELMRSRAALSTTTPEWREPRVHATAKASICLRSSPELHLCRAHCSWVMSVTEPRRSSFPLWSETLTTARTTADLSLSRSSVSILAWATGAEYTFFEPAGLRSGAWISSSFARGSEDGGAAPVKILFKPVKRYFPDSRLC